MGDEFSRADVGSRTAPYHDIDDDDRLDVAYRRAVDSHVRRGPLSGQVGAVVGRAEELVGLEVFASRLLAHRRESLVCTALLDAPAPAARVRRPSLDAVVDVIAQVANSPGREYEAVALGREQHLDTEAVVAQALSWDSLLVHGRAFALAA